MANGVTTLNVDPSSTVDQLLGNKEGGTVLISLEDLATMLAAGGAVAEKIAVIGTNTAEVTTDILDAEARLVVLETTTYAESKIYDDTTSALAATVIGEQFKVLNTDPDISYDWYEHDADDEALFLVSISSPAALAAFSPAALAAKANQSDVDALSDDTVKYSDGTTGPNFRDHLYAGGGGYLILYLPVPLHYLYLLSLPLREEGTGDRRMHGGIILGHSLAGVARCPLCLLIEVKLAGMVGFEPREKLSV